MGILILHGKNVSKGTVTLLSVFKFELTHTVAAPFIPTIHVVKCHWNFW